MKLLYNLFFVLTMIIYVKAESSCRADPIGSAGGWCRFDATDGRCFTFYVAGSYQNDYVCPNGTCCSSRGYCGNSSKHCLSGCQGSLGSCGIDFVISSDGRCGSKYGKCPNSGCCSQYGYCGSDNAHCGKGCQSKYGECGIITKISKDGICGSKSGKCPSNQCCSKHGYCGTSSKHCLKSEGCLVRYGKCK